MSSNTTTLLVPSSVACVLIYPLFYQDRVQMGVYRPTTTNASNTPAEEALLKEFGDMLSAGGSEVTIFPEIQRIKFSKNFWNCVLGATAALSRLPLYAIFRPPHMDPGASGSPPAADAAGLRPETKDMSASQKAVADIPSRSPLIHEHTVPLLYDTLTEMYALGTALFPATEDGPGLDPDIVMRTMKNTSGLHAVPDSKHKASMLLDLEHGRPLELEVVMGEVVRLGRKMGVPMPVSIYNIHVTRIVLISCTPESRDHIFNAFDRTRPVASYL